MNRSLARLLRRSAGIGSADALGRVLDEAVTAAPGLNASPELKALIEGMGDLLAHLGGQELALRIAKRGGSTSQFFEAIAARTRDTGPTSSADR